MEMQIALDAVTFRARCCRITSARQTIAGSWPYVTTPGGIEDSFRNPVQDRPAYDVLFPRVTPFLLQKIPLRSTSEGVSPRHAFVRGTDDPVPLALEASVVKRAGQRDIRMLNGEDELETP